MKRSRHFSGGVNSRAAFRRLAKEQSQTPTHPSNKGRSIERRRNRKAAGLNPALPMSAASGSFSPSGSIADKGAISLRDSFVPGERAGYSRSEAIASRIIRQAENPASDEWQLAEGLRIPERPSDKSHRPYVLLSRCERAAVVSPFSRCDHSHVWQPELIAWAENQAAVMAASRMAAVQDPRAAQFDSERAERFGSVSRRKRLHGAVVQAERKIASAAAKAERLNVAGAENDATLAAIASARAELLAARKDGGTVRTSYVAGSDPGMAAVPTFGGETPSLSELRTAQPGDIRRRALQRKRAENQSAAVEADPAAYDLWLQRQRELGR